ncbi:MAG: amino acid ABC transporter permease [Candidatus Promineifilaceae bacterium]
MSAIYQNLQSLISGQREIKFNPTLFVQENLTRSWWTALWLVVLTYVTVRITLAQLAATPVTTIIVLVVWASSVIMTAINEVTRSHSNVSTWLKNNLYSSITNVQISLILTLVVIAAVQGFISWAFLKASFTTDSVAAAQTLDQFAEPGANWGAVVDNFRLLMLFRFPQDQTWRIFAVLFMLLALAVPSSFVYRGDTYRRSPIRRILTILWVLSPLVAFWLLKGFGVILNDLNPDNAWGGFLLTLILAVFGIVASFPLGLFLALGRRSTIRGIPGWLAWSLATVLTVWGLLTSTQTNLALARSFSERILSFWPLVIPIITFLFLRYFKGNVVALFCTLYIECVRGVPLITVLFMSIIIFPIFLPPNVEILNTWRVMVAVALFAAAYLAENVRGGLQSIPKGQYEAADAIGLNTLQKYRMIILPQALRVVIPAIVGQFIGLFKDTTLIAIVGLIELLGVANLISAQQDWLGVRREPYVFIAIIYFIGNALMAWYSRRLESRLGIGQR